MGGKIELQVEAGEITALLLLDLLDVKLGEYHPAFGVVGMRKRKESRRKRVRLPDLVGTHGLKCFPGHSVRKCDTYPCLDRFPAGHRDRVGRTVGEVVPIIE